MISKLAGLIPVWDGEVEKGVNGVKKELINYWTKEARKGRTIEEFVRYNDSLLDLWLQSQTVFQKGKSFFKQFIYRDEGRPELAELVANERKRKAELPD